MNKINKFVDKLIEDYAKAEAENITLRTRVKVLEEMLLSKKADEEKLDSEDRLVPTLNDTITGQGIDEDFPAQEYMENNISEGSPSL